uniref:Nuclear pore complex protein Nup214 n=1 Tax=Ditylenchus dipsaci TaxID=166011 RepID=A0A915CPR9_9BILA
MEDLQLRPLCKTRIFDKVSDVLKGSSFAIPKLIATSSRYGITVVFGPSNKIYSCDISNIHQLGLPINGQSDIRSLAWRVINYHDSQCEVCFLDINADGSTLAVSLNTVNGPFVHLFDMRCFRPSTNKQPFPVASIRLSSSNAAKVLYFEWNPCDNKFAVSTSDNTLVTVEYDLQKGSSYSILSNLSAKSAITCIAWSRKGQQLTAGDAEGKLYQMKPEQLNAAVRTMEAPQNVAELGPMQPFDVLVSAGFCLLVAKKGQPISWTFYGYYASGTNVPLQPSARFYFVENWVLVSSSQSSFIRVITKQGEVWKPMTSAIQLPPSYDQKETYPFGCSFDFSSGNQQGLPPLFYHPLTTKTIEPFSVEQANFGKPPPAYQPQSSPASTPLMPVSQPQPVQQPQIAMPTSVTQTTANSLFGNTAAHKLSAPPSQPVQQQVQQSAPQSAPQPAQPPPKTVEMPKEETLAERQAKELVQLEQAFEKAVGEYCKQRNAQAKKVDALRELRGETEQWSSTQNDDNFDEFSEMIRDIQVSLDDAELGLENFQDHLIHNTEGSAKRGEGDFNQRKKMELLQKKYEKAIENFARMKILLEKTTSEKAPVIELRLHNEEINPAEQKKINETTEKISKMVVKLSAKIINLQKKVRSINSIRKSSDQLNQSSRSDLLKINSSSSGGNTAQLADQCTIMLKEVLICEDLENRRRSSRRSGVGEVEPEKVSQMQSNLYNLMKAHSQKPVSLTPVTPNRLLPESKYATANKPSPVDNITHLNTPSTSKPRLVSIGVQSPDFTRTSSTPNRAISGVTPKTSLQTTNFPKPTFSSTPLSSNTANVTPGVGTQRTIPNASVPLFSTPTTVRSEKPVMVAPLPQSSSAPLAKILAAPKPTPTPISEVSTAAQPPAPVVVSTAAQTPVSAAAPSFSFKLAAAKDVPISGTETSTTIPTAVSSVSLKNEVVASQSIAATSILGSQVGAKQPDGAANQVKPLVGNTTANGQPSKVAGDEGMDDTGAAATGNTAAVAPALPSSGGINFSFAGTGLGSSVSANANKNPFGSALPAASSTQSPAANTNWMFANQTPTPQTTQKPSLFGQATGGSTGFGSIQSNPAPTQSAFGSVQQNSLASQNGTGFGSAPAFGQGKVSAFGGGPSFGTSSPFGGGGFGTAGPTPFSSPANQQPSTPSNTSGGFSAFANKSSGFGQLAANASSPQQSLFGSGGGATPSQMAHLLCLAMPQAQRLCFPIQQISSIHSFSKVELHAVWLNLNVL